MLRLPIHVLISIYTLLIILSFSFTWASSVKAERRVKRKVTRIVSTPQIKPRGGTFQTKVSVRLQSSTRGASIYYTIDGSNPTPQSNHYTHVISITEGSTIKARAFRKKYAASGIATASFRKTHSIIGTPVPSPDKTARPPERTPSTPPSTPPPVIPLESAENKMLFQINLYRQQKFASPFLPSIALSYSSDSLSRDNAARGVLSTTDSMGRAPLARARAYGFTPNASVETITGRGTSVEEVINGWKANPLTKVILEEPSWKTIGIARFYDSTSGKYYWTADFASFWDITIPLPGEDADGRIDGSEMIRTRPPSTLLAQGIQFTGYGDDGQWYSGLHCPIGIQFRDPREVCYKDAPDQGNPSLASPSSKSNLSGLYHVQYMISPTGVKHYNDCQGWDLTPFSINLTIKDDGTWSSQGYRVYQVPTPTDSGTWTSEKSAVRDEEVVTFTRRGGGSATIRVRATNEGSTGGKVLTFYAVAGASFLQGVPEDGNAQDDTQVIFNSGSGCLFAPHGPLG